MRKVKATLHMYLEPRTVYIYMYLVPAAALYKDHALRVSSAESVYVYTFHEDEGSVRSDGSPALLQLLSLS